jgi:hypothetical protein
VQLDLDDGGAPDESFAVLLAKSDSLDELGPPVCAVSHESEVASWLVSESISDATGRGLLRDGNEPSIAPMWTLGQSGPDPPYTIYDLHADHLGTTRVVTDETGEIYALHDFYPFGEEITGMYDYNTKLFTGHERDEDTGLDYMLAWIGLEEAGGLT